MLYFPPSGPSSFIVLTIFILDTCFVEFEGHCKVKCIMSSQFCSPNPLFWVTDINTWPLIYWVRFCCCFTLSCWRGIHVNSLLFFIPHLTQNLWHRKDQQAPWTILSPPQQHTDVSTKYNLTKNMCHFKFTTTFNATPLAYGLLVALAFIYPNSSSLII